MYAFHLLSRSRTDTNSLGHYRLWVNRICHGDISLTNLMYDVSAETNDPVGVVNDFDLATWVNHSTTNNDRFGTIPFMAMDLLEGGHIRHIPQLYRHDMESFSWVLAYITVAYIEYKDRTIKISPLGNVEAWFRDDYEGDRRAHILAKKIFHKEYGRAQGISGRYRDYHTIIRKITQYWPEFHETRAAAKHRERPRRLYPNPIQEEPAPSEPEIDDPAGSLRSFIMTVKGLLEEGEGDGTKGFAVIKDLLEAIEIPVTDVSAP